MKPSKYNYNSQTGMFRHKILLRRTVRSLDELLQEIETSEDFGTYWAMIKTHKGSEILNAAQEQTKIQTRFVVKYSRMLESFIQSDKTTFEIIYKGVSYNVIEAINDNEMNETVTIVGEGRV